jgi:hypothetical protein
MPDERANAYGAAVPTEIDALASFAARGGHGVVLNEASYRMIQRQRAFVNCRELNVRHRFCLNRREAAKTLHRTQP